MNKNENPFKFKDLLIISKLSFKITNSLSIKTAEDIKIVNIIVFLMGLNQSYHLTNQ